MSYACSSADRSNQLIRPPFDIPTDIRERLIVSLDSWNFEPHKLPDEEVLYCSMLLFEILFRIEGMDAAIGMSLSKHRVISKTNLSHFRIQTAYQAF